MVIYSKPFQFNRNDEFKKSNSIIINIIIIIIIAVEKMRTVRLQERG